MKKTILAFAILLTTSIGIVSCSSSSDSSPSGLATVTTVDATSISSTSATVGGNVTDDSGNTVTARGICWSTTPNPTVEDDLTTETGTTGAFTSSLTSLTANTVYYARAYAINSAGTAYGNQVTFTTAAAPTTFISFKYNNVQYTFVAETWDNDKKDIHGWDGINMDYKVIDLYMPLNPTLGAHPITHFGVTPDLTTYEGHFHFTADFLTFDGDTGNITITTLNSTTIAGTFEFYGVDDNGDPVSVTNGTFSSTRNQL
ncbi:hypothetical protein [Flavobacterium sp. XGLA_31]|uniref:hypothetical protein n=1 Tax=Flavobacterium sp. XGLA_31 TaxID=3447666 RepID=UPI003F2EDA16